MIVEIDQNCNNNIITYTFKNPNFANVYVRNRIRFVTTINTHHHSYYQVVELFFRRFEYLKAKNRARLVQILSPGSITAAFSDGKDSHRPTANLKTPGPSRKLFTRTFSRITANVNCEREIALPVIPAIPRPMV